MTIGTETFPLPKPFLVLATQNPVEQEGTCPLPEAQVDRFMLKLRVSYPSLEEERRIVGAMSVTDKQFSLQSVVTSDAILRARKVVDEIYIDEKVMEYILALVRDTFVNLGEVTDHNAAKRLVHDGQVETALELLKNTRLDPVIYANGLGYIIPLVAKRDQSLSHRLRQEFLDPQAMTDAQAMCFLADHFQSEGDQDGAVTLYDVCLRLDPLAVSCREGKSNLEDAGTSSPKPVNLDYDQFFKQ